MSISSYADMARTAVESPEQVPPWLKRKALGPARRAATRRALEGKPRQGTLLDDLRGDDYLLIVLDACRYDVLQECFGRLFDRQPRAVASEGHDTFQYVSRCWSGSYPGTTYISGATPVNSDPSSEFADDHLQALYGDYVPSEHIGEIVDVWRTGWNESLGTCPPEAVCRETLERLDEDRLVAHMFQPHAPYIGEARELGHTGGEDARPREGTPVDAPVWERVQSGDMSRRRLREAYRSNLRRALASVGYLVSELRARGDGRRVVVMGDHGEALGEWGVYAHPRTAHPNIRVVPWVEIGDVTESLAALGSRVEFGEESDGQSGDVSDRLRSLGYL